MAVGDDESPWKGEAAAASCEEIEPMATFERRLAVATLSSEVVHAIGPTLMFFRDLIATAPLDDEDRSLGKQEIERLEHLVACLRRTRRVERQAELVELEPLVQRTPCHVEIIQDKHLNFDVRIEPGLRVLAHPVSLQLLLIALLRNAANAAPRHGRIAVRAESVERACVLDVEDNGPGVPAFLQNTLFQPLVGLGLEGAGMGLAMALRVTRELNGRLTYRRQDGSTLFRLRLPIAPGAGVEGRKRSSEAL